MKRLIGVLLAAALPTLAAAQGPREAFQIPLAIDFDLDSTSFTYPISQGMLLTTPAAGSRAESVLSTIPGNAQARITTAGLSTTVSALVASSAPFNAVQVGDFIRARTVGNLHPDVAGAVEGQQSPWLVVTARASADSVTVNQAVDFTGGVGWEWRRAYQGVQAGKSWIPVRNFETASFLIRFAGTTDAAGFNTRVECRHDWPGVDTASMSVVKPSHTGATAAEECGAGAILAADQSCTISDAVVTAGLGTIQFTIDTAGWYECRVGVRINTADDAADAVVETLRVDFVGTSK